MDDERWAVLEPIHTYADACDRRDWALFDRVFVPDAEGEYGGTVLRGRDAIVAMISSLLGGCGPSQHLLGNPQIVVDGDAARSVVRVRASHAGSDDDRRFEVWGAYHDELVRTDAGWRIARRRMAADHQFGDRSVLGPRR